MYKLLTVGDAHPGVLEVKKFLKSRGYPVDIISEVYTKDTEQSVNAFKRSMGLPEDGLLDTGLWVQIDNITPQKASEMGLRTSLKDITREWIIRDKTAVEAGYVNNADDLGGETNHGIILEVAMRNKDDLVTRFGWNGNMRFLTQEMAFYIYVKDYWNKMRCDALYDIHPLLADKVFDIGINCGIGRAALWMQQILNVMNNKQKLYPDIAEDSAIGNQTLRALSSYLEKRGERALPRFHLALFNLQGAHYITISKAREQNETFTYGWYSRVEHNMELYHENIWSV